MAKILAVDDDPRVRRYVSRVLREAGHEVTCAEDAESSLALLLTARPDLFLVDINLPGMNGLILSQKLQTQRGTLDIPVVILSVRTDPRDKVAAYASGAVTYLEKPFKKAHLLAAVNAGLEWSRERRGNIVFFPSRSLLRDILAYDEKTDLRIIFEPQAVRALIEAG